MRYSIWLAAFALIALPNTSVGQIPADSLIRGDHVRYELTGPLDGLPDESEGTFGALTPSAVILADVDGHDILGSVELPRELIDDLEVARGTKSIRWPGAVIVGAVGCGILGTVFGTSGDGDAGAGLVGCGIGFVAGGILGYFVGSAITDPRWVEVDLD